MKINHSKEVIRDNSLSFVALDATFVNAVVNADETGFKYSLMMADKVCGN